MSTGPPAHQRGGGPAVRGGRRGWGAVVVHYTTGPTTRSRGGAPAFALLNETGPFVGRDPGAGRVEGFPPTLPRDVRGIYGVVYDAQGNPLHPLGETVPPRGAVAVPSWRCDCSAN